MDTIRKILWATFFLNGLLLWQAWQQDYLNHQPAVIKTPKIKTPQSLEKSQRKLTEKRHEPLKRRLPADRSVTFKTDVLEGVIDKQGGHIVRLALLKYPQSESSKVEPFTLLDQSDARYYIAETDLLTTTDKFTSTEHQRIYRSDFHQYVLSPTQKELSIDLYWQDKSIQIRKRFTFRSDDYQIKVNYQVNNQSNTTWKSRLYAQLVQHNPQLSNSWFGMSSYNGGVISNDAKPYEKIKFSKIKESVLPQAVSKGGWLSFVEPHFATSWISQLPLVSYYSQKQQNTYVLGFSGREAWQVLPQQKADLTVCLYAGPKQIDYLRKAADKLELLVDYGLSWFVAVKLFWILKQVYRLIGNWGWSIVIVTLLFKFIFYHLSAKQARTMLIMQSLQPRIDALKERYADDPLKLYQTQTVLYQREGISRMSGIWPLLLQIPIFLAFYAVLMENVEFRQEPFILWINDLTARDPYYILPMLTGLTGLLDQKIIASSPTEMDKNTLIFLQIFVTYLFFSNLSAGILLYWITQNIFSILQKRWILYKTKLSFNIYEA